MKIFNKTKLNVALSSAFAGLVLVASQSAVAMPESAPLDTSVNDNSTYNAAGVGSILGDTTNTTGPYVSKNNLGQALVYPYYTVNNGMKTLINVVNTDSTRAVAVKVRFRESENSRDVLDFNLVLSPSDKWSGYLELGANGPYLKTADNSCTAPAIPAGGANFSSDSYLGGTFQDVGTQTKERMNEGYAEIIAMGWADPTKVAGVAELAVNAAYNAVHTATGVPRSCLAVRNAFLPTNTVAPAGDATQASGATNPNGLPTAMTDFIALAPGENPLRGTLVIQNKDGGIAAGTAAVAIADFMDIQPAGGLTVATLTGVAPAAAALGDNLVTSQSYPFYLEPTLASRDGVWTLSGLIDVDKALASSTLMNEWASNSANGANVDWTVTFPTKSFHVDAPGAGTVPGYTTGHYQSGVSIHRSASVAGTVAGANNWPGIASTLTAKNGVLYPFSSGFLATGGSKVDLGASVGLYDNEEQTSTAGLEFSPGTFSTPNLPYEANVITFDNTSVLSSANPLKLTPPNGAKSGWAQFSFGTSGGTLPMSGLPVTGFAMKQRNSGNAALNYGQIMAHSYK